MPAQPSFLAFNPPLPVANRRRIAAHEQYMRSGMLSWQSHVCGLRKTLVKQAAKAVSEKRGIMIDLNL
jgi:hypothetical protein